MQRLFAGLSALLLACAPAYAQITPQQAQTAALAADAGIVQAQTALATLKAYAAQPPAVVTVTVQAPPPAPAPVALNPLGVPVAFDLTDQVIAPTARSMTFRVRLKAAVNRTLTLTAALANGTCAYAPQYYDQFQLSAQRIVFLPGETEKLVNVVTKQALGSCPKLDPATNKPLLDAAGKTIIQPGSIKFVINGGLNNPPIPGQVINIVEAATAPAVTSAAPGYALPAFTGSTGRTMVFQSTFQEPISPNAVKGAWRSRPAWGRLQCGNSEVAPNTDATTDAGVHPHIRDAQGHLVLQAENVATTDVSCTTVGAKANYAYSAAMIQSENLFMYRYGYAEYRVAFGPYTKGNTDAIWLVQPTWPPENDVCERGLYASTECASTVHWAAGPMEGTATGFMPDTAIHVIGYEWTPLWVATTVDGKLVNVHANVYNIPAATIFNTAVGGLGNPMPTWTAPSSFTLYSWTVWQKLDAAGNVAE